MVVRAKRASTAARDKFLAMLYTPRTPHPHKPAQDEDIQARNQKRQGRTDEDPTPEPNKVGDGGRLPLKSHAKIRHKDVAPHKHRPNTDEAVRQQGPHARPHPGEGNHSRGAESVGAQVEQRDAAEVESAFIREERHRVEAGDDGGEARDRDQPEEDGLLVEPINRPGEWNGEEPDDEAAHRLEGPSRAYKRGGPPSPLVLNDTRPEADIGGTSRGPSLRQKRFP